MQGPGFFLLCDYCSHWAMSTPPTATLLSCSSHLQNLVLIVLAYRNKTTTSTRLCPTSREGGDVWQEIMAEKEEHGSCHLQSQAKH